MLFFFCGNSTLLIAIRASVSRPWLLIMGSLIAQLAPPRQNTDEEKLFTLS